MGLSGKALCAGANSQTAQDATAVALIPVHILSGSIAMGKFCCWAIYGRRLFADVVETE